MGDVKPKADLFQVQSLLECVSLDPYRISELIFYIIYSQNTLIRGVDA
jgi:hypothetical protein